MLPFLRFLTHERGSELSLCYNHSTNDPSASIASGSECPVISETRLKFLRRKVTSDFSHVHTRLTTAEKRKKKKAIDDDVQF